MERKLLRLSYAISLQPTSFEAITVGDWEKKVEFLAELGYSAVELAVRKPSIVDIEYLDNILNRYSIALSAIGTGQVFLEEGLSLSDSDLAIRNSAVLRIKEHIKIAGIFGSQVILGLIRGGNEKGNDEKKFFLMDSCKKVCEFAARDSIAIAIEPINRYETSLLNTVDETIEFIDQIGYEKLKILLDTFHMNIEEKDICESIDRAKDYISHLHFADSNRRYIGAGHLDFLKIIKKLKEFNYDSYISGEILPLPDFDTAARKFLDNTKKLLNEVEQNHE